MSNIPIYVTGDHSIDQFIYVEGKDNNPPDLRESWIQAQRFWKAKLPGGPDALCVLLKSFGIQTEIPVIEKENTKLPESIYILTQQKIYEKSRWRIGRAIIAGEREYETYKLKEKKNLNPDFPTIIIDHNQGFLSNNKAKLRNFLKERQYLIRTHDPRNPIWKDIRSSLEPGFWFSPMQDMANGSLQFAGNWEDMKQRIIEYLKADETLWDNDNSRWIHSLIIQIYNDGILFLGPHPASMGDNHFLNYENLYIFAGDQPTSFSWNGYDPVIGSGNVIVASLAKILIGTPPLTFTKMKTYLIKGLARIRTLIEEGYDNPTEKDPSFLKRETNIPIPTLKKSISPKVLEIIEYKNAPSGAWKFAKKIVCGGELELYKNITLRLGDYYVADSNYAKTILQLISRLNNHAHDKKDKSILSFSIFGGPGSGKSLLAEKIANLVKPKEQEFETMNFNISQFESPKRLIKAFQEIQTVCLKGKIPFVLWDEFDTFYQNSKAGWVPFFLQPMQDRKFWDDHSEQQLGKCVFVFIGGIFNDTSEFMDWALYQDGKNLKGTDFHSRLDRCLVVPSLEWGYEVEKRFTEQDPAKLTRAVLIRAFLGKKEKVTKISRDMLFFLLHVPLIHGARSLQKIIEASQLDKTDTFQRWHLPSKEVIESHVNDNLIQFHDTFAFIDDFLEKLNYHDYLNDEPNTFSLEWR